MFTYFFDDHGVICNSNEIILVLNGAFHGPFPNTVENIEKIREALKD
jgi:hypothetical protein